MATVARGKGGISRARRAGETKAAYVAKARAGTLGKYVPTPSGKYELVGEDKIAETKLTPAAAAIPAPTTEYVITGAKLERPYKVEYTVSKAMVMEEIRQRVPEGVKVTRRVYRVPKGEEFDIQKMVTEAGKKEFRTAPLEEGKVKLVYLAPKEPMTWEKMGEEFISKRLPFLEVAPAETRIERGIEHGKGIVAGAIQAPYLIAGVAAIGAAGAYSLVTRPVETIKGVGIVAAPLALAGVTTAVRKPFALQREFLLPSYSLESVKHEIVDIPKMTPMERAKEARELGEFVGFGVVTYGIGKGIGKGIERMVKAKPLKTKAISVMKETKRTPYVSEFQHTGLYETKLPFGKRIATLGRGKAVVVKYEKPVVYIGTRGEFKAIGKTLYKGEIIQTLEKPRVLGLLGKTRIRTTKEIAARGLYGRVPKTKLYKGISEIVVERGKPAAAFEISVRVGRTPTGTEVWKSISAIKKPPAAMKEITFVERIGARPSARYFITKPAMIKPKVKLKPPITPMREMHEEFARKALVKTRIDIGRPIPKIVTKERVSVPKIVSPYAYPTMREIERPVVREVTRKVWKPVYTVREIQKQQKARRQMFKRIAGERVAPRVAVAPVTAMIAKPKLALAPAVAVSPAVAQAVSPRLAQAVRTRLAIAPIAPMGLAFKPITTPPHIPIVPYYFPFGFPKKRIGREFKPFAKAPARKYRPSLIGIATGIKVTKVPKMFTGVGIRYPLKRKKKRRKR